MVAGGGSGVKSKSNRGRNLSELEAKSNRNRSEIESKSEPIQSEIENKKRETRALQQIYALIRNHTFKIEPHEPVSYQCNTQKR